MGRCSKHSDPMDLWRQFFFLPEVRYIASRLHCTCAVSDEAVKHTNSFALIEALGRLGLRLLKGKGC